MNLRKNDEYGVLEVGMDKKGEIDYLSKIIQPNVSVITNINFAHAKNFKNLKLNMLFLDRTWPSINP